MADQIECYNGFMLCKRPIAEAPAFQSRVTTEIPSTSRVTTTKANSSPNAKKPQNIFWKPSGGSTRNAERNKVIKRLKKNDSALRRHKQWLKQMQVQREEKIRARNEEIKMKEELKREFSAKQAKKRARAIDSRDTDDCKDPINDSIIHSKDNVPMTSADSVDKQSRPAWSLTEMEAHAKHYSKEEQEENDLLDFVEKLDCESFYEDLELKILINQVKDRIRLLEKEKNKDESKLTAVMEVRNHYAKKRTLRCTTWNSFRISNISLNMMYYMIERMKWRVFEVKNIIIRSLYLMRRC